MSTENTAFILSVLETNAQRLRGLVQTLEYAKKRIADSTEAGENIPLEQVARALNPLGFCVVHRDALLSAVTAMETIDAIESDIVDEQAIADFARAREHLTASLRGF